MVKLNNNLSGIFGPKGSGKTYLAAQMLGKEHRAIVWNSAFDIELDARATHIVTGGRESAEKIWDLAKKPDAQFRVVFQPKDFQYNATRTRLFAPSLDTVSAICMDAQDVTLYFDEAHKLLGAGYAPPHFLNILQEGRHKRVSLILISHRMARIPKDFTQEVDDYYFFQTAEENDLDDIEERCGRLVAKRVANLRRLDLTGANAIPGQYYHFDAMRRIGYVIEAKNGHVVATDDIGVPRQMNL